MIGQRKKLIAGNWKMNGNLESLEEIELIKRLCASTDQDVIICPPSTLLVEAKKILGNTQLKVGAQNCQTSSAGPHTGEISAQMLSDLGVEFVILGHSERREKSFETDEVVRNKASEANAKGLTTIICVGETGMEKKLGKTETVIESQIKNSLPNTFSHENTIIAYEPLWAIGSGITPTPNEIAHIHLLIRSVVKEMSTKRIAEKIKLLYGGSVNPTNAKELLSITNVDGALVGGASLLAEDFSRIVGALS